MGILLEDYLDAHRTKKHGPSESAEATSWKDIDWEDCLNCGGSVQVLTTADAGYVKLLNGDDSGY